MNNENGGAKLVWINQFKEIQDVNTTVNTSESTIK
jgi:hypothetical protein